VKPINSLVQKPVSIAPNTPLAISSVWSTRKVTSQMNRIDHILGNLASAAPKIALLVALSACFMIGGSTLASAEQNPTLQCEYVGHLGGLFGYSIYHWFWVYVGGYRVDTGRSCGPSPATPPVAD
jgi:hypothetical protein